MSSIMRKVHVKNTIFWLKKMHMEFMRLKPWILILSSLFIYRMRFFIITYDSLYCVLVVRVSSILGNKLIKLDSGGIWKAFKIKFALPPKFTT